jgi:Helicase HerA, central domain
MIAKTINQMSAATNPLILLLDEKQGNKHVGFTIHASYSEMVVMTNDRWRHEADGMPMNSYLLATSVDVDNFSSADPIDKRAVLLRIVGRTQIATDGDALRAIMEHFQDQPKTIDPAFRSMEPISFAMLQWSGIKTKVLGTFYMDSDSRLRFGADVEDFFAARQMKVLKPGLEALETIVNFVDPIRQKKAADDARTMGMKRTPNSFQIGTVRFTSAAHMSSLSSQSGAAVRIFPGDFLGRRTAVFGMTRTGKSNTTKTMVSAVMLSSLETDLPVGQIIFDVNGEYSNANNQDEGSSIADVFGDNTIRYRAKVTPGFRDVRVDFYRSFDMGHQFIASNLREEGGSMSDELKAFLAIDLSPPADQQDIAAQTLWKRRTALYQCILKASEYPHVATFEIEFPVHQNALAQIYKSWQPVRDSQALATNDEARANATVTFFNLKALGRGIYRASPDDAVAFWSAVRTVEKTLRDQTPAAHIMVDKKVWLNEEEFAMLCVLVGRSGKTDTQIRSRNAIKTAASQFHSPAGSANVAKDIYGLLEQGRIVIVDLSVGPPSIRERMAERIARHIFDTSSDRFTAGRVPPRIVIYAEETHNLIGKSADLDTTWPRIAKEGAKYGISIVYATQEPSSVHPNILSNTENFFVTHLNNDSEIKALSSYYDFDDFGESLKRCQDVGFARVKMLSANFTTPTQILLFEPAKVAASYTAAKRNAPSWFKSLPNPGQ